MHYLNVWFVNCNQGNKVHEFAICDIITISAKIFINVKQILRFVLDLHYVIKL